MHIDTITCGLRTITASEIDIKDNICLTEEHGANKALTRRLEATQGNRLEPAITTFCISLLPLPKNKQRHSMLTLLLLPGYRHFNSAYET